MEHWLLFDPLPNHVFCATTFLPGQRSTMNWILSGWRQQHEFHMKQAKCEMPLKIKRKEDEEEEITVRFSLREYTKFYGRGNEGQRWCSLWVSTPSEITDSVCLQIKAQTEIEKFRGDLISTKIVLTPEQKSVEFKEKFLYVSTWNNQKREWRPVSEGLAHCVTVWFSITPYRNEEYRSIEGEKKDA